METKKNDVVFYNPFYNDVDFNGHDFVRQEPYIFVENFTKSVKDYVNTMKDMFRESGFISPLSNDNNHVLLEEIKKDTYSIPFN